MKFKPLISILTPLFYRPGATKWIPPPACPANVGWSVTGSHRLRHHVGQECIAKRKRTEGLQPKALHALIILVLQVPVDQALAGIIASAHLLPLSLQLTGQVAAVVKPVLRAAANSVPGLSRATEVARGQACALARSAGRASARLLQATCRTVKFGKNWLCLSDRMPERARAALFLDCILTCW